MTQLTLTADSPAPTAPIPGYDVRSFVESDIRAIGELYFDAYEAGEACETLEEAIADIEASFAGEYGPLWPEASLVAIDERSIVATIMTVVEAPWPNSPPGPFIIELFTDRRHRRLGLARHLVASVLGLGEGASLRVDSENRGAVALYRSLGFS